MTFEVEVWTVGNSQSKKYNARSTYQQGNFYCVMYLDESGRLTVDKYPMLNVFRVREEYKYV